MDQNSANVLSQDAKNMAMLSHLSALAGAFIGGIGSWVGPLVIWLIKKDQDPFVAEHAKEALNFNLFLALLAVAGVLLTIVTLGLGAIIVVPLAIAVFVVFLVFTIQAAMKANNGEMYRYPVTIRFIS